MPLGHRLGSPGGALRGRTRLCQPRGVDATTDEALRSDIRRIGQQLGDTLIRQEGMPFFELVEEIRALAKEIRTDDDRAVLLDRLDRVDEGAAIRLV